jgi:hypothetical protein
MTFETIDFHRRIVVAADAKIAWRSGNAMGLLAGVTADACLQAVFRPPDAIVNSLIALMLEVEHVIAPHGGCVFDTAVPMC